MRIERRDRRPSRLAWLTPDPTTLARRLSELGFHVSPGPTGGLDVVFPELCLAIERDADGSAERFAAFERTSHASRLSAAPSLQGHPNGVTGVLAVGFASVDADRMAAQFAGAEFVPAAPDDALGARARTDARAHPHVTLLEPSTEGRLAAALARNDEGPVALYLAVEGLISPLLASRLRPPRRWPGGDAARLLAPARPWGPFVFLVETAQRATPQRAEPATTPRGG
jgi:hypothetical protein